MKFVRDLFMGVGNQHWDLARIAGAKTIAAFLAAFVYRAFWSTDPINWSDTGTGFGAMLAGVVLLIGGKDIASAKSKKTTEGMTE